jgi:phosphothreonine lyase
MNLEHIHNTGTGPVRPTSPHDAGAPSGTPAPSRSRSPSPARPASPALAGIPAMQAPGEDGFKLSTLLSQPQAGSAMKKPGSVVAQLTRDFEKLDSEMGALPQSGFTRAKDVPDYETLTLKGMNYQTFHSMSKLKQALLLREIGKQKIGEFNVLADRGFVHAKADGGGSIKEGDKFHISVDEAQLKSAFNAIAPLLFSADSPIREWKRSIVEIINSTRLSQGAQFTLYASTDKDGHYSAAGLKKIRDFMNELDRTLTEHGIGKGVRPQSDVAPDHWHHVSYRNENRSSREESGGDALKNEPFYRLVSGSRAEG